MSLTSAPAVRARAILPGFRLTLGTTVLYLSIIVLIPIIALVLTGAGIGPARLWAIITAPRTLASLRITITAAAVATVINAAYGLLMAWVLVRYRFPGRRLLDARSCTMFETNSSTKASTISTSAMAAAPS